MRFLPTIGALLLAPLLLGASALDIARDQVAQADRAGVLPTLVVPERIDAVGERVTVGDAVQDTDLPASFLRMRLARAPGPCDTVQLSGAYIEAQLRSALVDSGLRATMQVPLEVEVRGSCQVIEPEAVEAHLTSVAREALPHVRDLQIELLRPTQALELPPGELQLVATPAVGENWIGQTAVPLRALVNGRVAFEARALLRVSGWAEAWTMRADLPRGQCLTEEHIELQEVLWSDLRHEPLRDLPAVLGMASRRSLHTGWMPREADFEVAASITTGEAVQVAVVAGGLRVRADGTARGEAALGDALAVRVESTGATVRGVLIAPGLVEVRR